MDAKRVLRGVTPLVVAYGVFALSSCSSDEADGGGGAGAPASAGTGQGGNPGVAGAGGPGGSAPIAGSGVAGSGTAGSGIAGSGTAGSGTAGSPTAGSGTGGASGGSGGAAGGSGGGSSGTCPLTPETAVSCASGCAVLCAPLAEMKTGTQWELPFAMPTDLTGATVTVRVKAVGSATALASAGVQTAVQNGETNSYASAGFAWTNASDLAEFTDIPLVVDTAATENAMFDKTSVVQLVVKVAAGDTGTWGPVQIYVDSITVTGAAATVGPFDFATSFMPLKQGTYMPVVGSTEGFQGM